jgi:hypothetical protein
MISIAFSRKSVCRGGDLPEGALYKTEKPEKSLYRKPSPCVIILAFYRFRIPFLKKRFLAKQIDTFLTKGIPDDDEEFLGEKIFHSFINLCFD